MDLSFAITQNDFKNKIEKPKTKTNIDEPGPVCVRALRAWVGRRGGAIGFVCWELM